METIYAKSYSEIIKDISSIYNTESCAKIIKKFRSKEECIEKAGTLYLENGRFYNSSNRANFDKYDFMYYLILGWADVENGEIIKYHPTGYSNLLYNY